MGYYLSGIFGYLRWNFEVNTFPQNLLKNYFCPHVVIYDIVVIAVALSFALSWPLMLFELRHSIDQLIFGHREVTYLRSFLLNICIIPPVVVVAVFVPGIVNVFGVVG